MKIVATRLHVLTHYTVSHKILPPKVFKNFLSKTEHF